MIILLNNGDCTFGKPDELRTKGPSIASSDFNHDGAPDLVILIQNFGKVAIMPNTQ